MSGPGGRLFEQPVVKVLPDCSEIARPQKKVSPAPSGSGSVRLKHLSQTDLSNLPTPPTVHSGSFRDEKKSEIKAEQEAPVASPPATPAYASITENQIHPDIDARLKKEPLSASPQYTTSTESESSSVPIYARVAPSSATVSSPSSLPAYAQVPTNPTTTATQSTSQAPAYLNFSSLSIHDSSSQSSTTQRESSGQDSYMPAYASYSKPSVPTPIVTQPPAPVATQPPPVSFVPATPPPFLPPRENFVLYHGYREHSSQPQPIPKPQHAPVSWMNVYGSQTEDELFVLREWFRSVDQDNSGEIDAEELGAALNAAGDSFDKGTVNLMIKIFDFDKNGTIEFTEFTKLFKYINTMRSSFDSFDQGQRGFLNEQCTQRALEAAKYQFQDPRTVQMLFAKFQRTSEGLSFEQFMQLAIYLGNLRTLFTLHDASQSGFIDINQEEFVLLDCSQYRQ